MGLELLRRTSHGVEITPAGEELLGRAEAILANVAGARRAVDEHAGTLRGGVRAAATTGDALRLAPALARFGREHPSVRIALRQGGPSEVVDLVAKGSVDLAVAALPEATALPEDVEAVALAPSRSCCSSRLMTPWREHRRQALGCPRPPVRACRAEHGAPWRRPGACAAEGFGPVPLFEVGEPTAVRFLVGAGLGVSLVPASWLSLEGPEVGVAKVAGATAVHAVALLTRRATPTPIARLLAEHLRATLG